MNHSKNRVAWPLATTRIGSMTDYDRIARIIRFLDANHDRRPDLAELAQQANLSPHHFHRLFSRWAGITPHQFLDCLSHSHARRLLREGESVLGTALAAGFSGPGRLHDLCVKLEAASPGEIRSGGSGWSIRAGFAGSPFGICLIGESRRGICHISFVNNRNRASGECSIRESWPAARISWDNAAAEKTAALLFSARDEEPGRSPWKAVVRGSAFQVRVWQALINVPAGTLVSYGRLARAIGQPNASRAVGGAVAGNPVAFLIPCHRVIRETGVIGNYRWGEIRKKAILAWENSPALDTVA